MEIKQHKKDSILTVELYGRLDTNTAPELQDTLTPQITDIKHITLDMKNLDYISSAGLRTLLFLHKKCSSEGISMTLIHCNEMTMDVFKMTGFDKFLDIK